ncbi:hypothetical protein DBR32_15500 [Taibaiella sp. KBW10]|uniref:T9SS type A sorting domain-containing protein n=1 Tax=Taibaiella sp. KBW10 TaxID=2153357 RepID=UPI000F5A11AA|nr:T9SS type A sorting domain-containing protein [Taibaiella sp. KBW10]RQO29662.1 hypothetical protein DBR32_15500 [Taibaiella sp. KBW10]
MKSLYTFLLILICVSLKVKAQDFVWMKQIGGTADEYITDKAFDGNQQLVSVGNAHGIVDLDPGPNVFMVQGSNNSPKTFVQKMDTDGNIIWIETIGGTGYIYTEALTIDAANNIYITGYFRGSIDFDPGPGQQIHTSTAAISSIFFMKLRANGSLEWVKVLEGTAQNVNQGFDIIVSKENGIYVSGTFGNGNIDFDPSAGMYLLSAPVRHIFVAKYTVEGTLIWAKSYGGDGPEESCVMDTDYQGNIYLAGQFSTNCDFDPGPATQMPYPNSQEKLYVLKWDKNGNFKWVRCFVGTGGSSYCNDIDYDNEGNLYVCGGFSGTMDFNDGGDGGFMTSTSTLSSYVVKLDTAGAYRWSFSFETSEAYRGHIDPYKNYYICGYYYMPNVDFDPGATVHTLPMTGNVQSYIAKYDSGGHFLWARGIQSSAVSRAKTLALDPTGNIYMSGQFNQSADFDPGIGAYNATANGADDIYLLKLFQCYLDPGVTVQNQTITAQATGVSYQWIDCNTGQAITGATNASFTPVQTGSYAVVLSSINGCKDTSNCTAIRIDPNSIEARKLSEQIQLYPNPGTGTYHLILPEGYTQCQVGVYDLLGRLILSQHIDQRTSILNLNAPAGVYFIHIGLQNGLVLKRKMIQINP